MILVPSKSSSPEFYFRSKQYFNEQFTSRWADYANCWQNVYTVGGGTNTGWCVRHILNYAEIENVFLHCVNISSARSSLWLLIAFSLFWCIFSQYSLLITTIASLTHSNIEHRHGDSRTLDRSNFCIFSVCMQKNTKMYILLGLLRDNGKLFYYLGEQQ